MGVMKFKTAKFPVQFGGNYNRLWRQAVLCFLQRNAQFDGLAIKVLMQILLNGIQFVEKVLDVPNFVFKDLLPQLIQY